jgi:sec-independent protein translocase protein TatA
MKRDQARPGKTGSWCVAGGGIAMFGFGFQELIIVLVIALVIFGGKKLPELGSGLGKAIREFKRGTSEPEEIDVTPKEVSEQPEKNDSKKDRSHA